MVRSLSVFVAQHSLTQTLIVSGLLIGAIFVQFATWHWIFWFVTMVTVPIAVLALLLVPKIVRAQSEQDQPKRLDLVGVSMFTGALILFIFALTSGAADGWSSAQVLTTLILSIALIVVFLIYEARIDASHAALPPKVWFFPNFAILVGTALIPYFWWLCVFLVYSPLWQEVYGWSTIMTAVRFLPLGIFAFVVAMFATSLPKYAHPRWIILIGLILVWIATILLPFADRKSRYWSLNFPSFTLGTMGAMAVYASANIAVFRTTPPAMAGTVGAVFNAALQLGGAVGVAAFTSIQTSVDTKKPGSELGYNGYSGRAAAWWFVLAAVSVATIAVGLLYRIDKEEVARKALEGDEFEKVDHGEKGHSIETTRTVTDDTN